MINLLAAWAEHSRLILMFRHDFRGLPNTKHAALVMILPFIGLDAFASALSDGVIEMSDCIFGAMGLMLLMLNMYWAKSMIRMDEEKMWNGLCLGYMNLPLSSLITFGMGYTLPAILLQGYIAITTLYVLYAFVKSNVLPRL